MFSVSLVGGYEASLSSRCPSRSANWAFVELSLLAGSRFSDNGQVETRDSSFLRRFPGVSCEHVCTFTNEFELRGMETVVC